MFRIALCDENREYLEMVRRKVESFCAERSIQIEMGAFDDRDILVNYRIRSGRKLLLVKDNLTEGIHILNRIERAL